MFTLKITNRATHKLVSFSDKEWEFADIRYHGRKVNWTKENLFLQAYEGKKLVGLLELTIEGGVMHILDLIVDHMNQKRGIGKALMLRAETVALENNVHKIFLETGKTWSVRKFYEKLGYKKTGNLLRHFIKEDYVEYTKFIDL